MYRCSNCGNEVNGPADLVETRDGRFICEVCAGALNFCEICGSTKSDSDEDEDDLLHYDEDCFK